MSDLNRREFVTIAAAACAACACSIAQAEEQAPGGPGAPRTPPPPNVGTVNVGKKTKYDKDGVNDEFAKPKRVLVVRNEGKIYAPTATCSHKNCAVKLKGTEITCPCHGSKFSLQGTPTKGPAKTSLYRYGISVDA